MHTTWVICHFTKKNDNLLWFCSRLLVPVLLLITCDFLLVLGIVWVVCMCFYRFYYDWLDWFSCCLIASPVILGARSSSGFSGVRHMWPPFSVISVLSSGWIGISRRTGAEQASSLWTTAVHLCWLCVMFHITLGPYWLMLMPSGIVGMQRVGGVVALVLNIMTVTDIDL